MGRERSIGASILSGFAVGIALYVLMSLLGWNGPESGSPWLPVLDQLTGALAAILPGLVAGSLSRRSGFAVGAAAGVLVSIVISLLTATVNWPPFWEPQEITDAFLADGIAYAVAALITNGVSGIAGAHLVFRWMPSNHTLDRDAPNSSARRSA